MRAYRIVITQEETNHKNDSDVVDKKNLERNIYIYIYIYISILEK
jgi:hypothetical protein